MQHSQQVILIWEELDYLRTLLGKILGKIAETNPDLKDYVNEELFNDCRMHAKIRSTQRFPHEWAMINAELACRSSVSEEHQEEVQQCNPPLI